MKPLIQPRLLGFEHLSVTWQEKWERYGVKIAQGDFCVTNQDVVITTVLGSCISVCIFDLTTGYGGMNHFMLPKLNNDCDVAKPLRYGLFSMEQLINQLLKSGCYKQNLQLKIIGGGRMMDNLSDIGQMNIDFIQQYIKDEMLTLISSDLGGDYGRKLAFFPTTGRLLVNRIPHIDTINVVASETVISKRASKSITQNDVELF